MRLVSTYIWTLVPVQDDAARPAGVDELKAEGALDHLAEPVSARLRQQGLLATVYACRNLRLELEGPLRSVWERGHVCVGELWSYYCRYPYLQRLKNRAVLDEAVASVMSEITWESEGFALAEEYDDAAGAYRGLRIPHHDPTPMVTDATLLVAPHLATGQREQETLDRAGSVGVGASSETPEGGKTRRPEEQVASIGSAPETKTRLFGVARIDPERYSRDLARIGQEILQHLSGAAGVDLEVTVEINARKADGFDDDKMRVISENASTLKLQQHGFETD